MENETANKYAGKVKAESEPDPGIIAEAWVEIWLRRINNSSDPEAELKALIEELHYKSMKFYREDV